MELSGFKSHSVDLIKLGGTAGATLVLKLG